MVVGVSIHSVQFLPVEQHLTLKVIYILAGGVAVALAMFLMTVTNTEHAPATSIALGFVINDWTPSTIILILVGITLISLIQKILKPHMIDLL